MNVQPTHSPLPHSVCLFSSNKVASLFFSPTNTGWICNSGETINQMETTIRKRRKYYTRYHKNGGDMFPQFSETIP